MTAFMKIWETKTYRSHTEMKSRCLNKKHPAYRYYGQRGITICSKWLGKDGFKNFLKDMGHCPPGLTLDRIDNDLGYSKENCRWATRKVQSINRSMMSNNTSGYRGVSFNKSSKKWIVHVSHKHIGTFDDKIEAAMAYDEVAKVMYGLDAKLNFPEEVQNGRYKLD